MRKAKAEFVSKHGHFWRVVREIIRWGALAVFIACVAIIFAESAVPAKQSGQQSGAVTDIIQDGINDGYDDVHLKEIQDFDIEISNQHINNVYHVQDIIRYEVTYTPVDTSYKNLIWSVNDPSLVSINEIKGEITCLLPGSVEITVKSEWKEELVKTLSFEIEEVLVESISVTNEKSISLNINDTHRIETSVLPNNAGNKKLIYSSSDDLIATVSPEGLVTANSAGNAVITISSESNPEAKDSISVEVNKSISYDVDKISHDDVHVYPSQTITSTGKFGPSGSTFSFDNLTVEKVDDVNNYLTISNGTINASKTSFTLKIKCANKTDIVDNDVVVKLTYNSNGTILEDTFVVHIHHIDQINSSYIDESKLTTNYSGKIYNNTYYSTTSNIVSDSITIKIPYTSEVTGAEYKFDKTGFTWTTPACVKVSSKNYKQIVIKPSVLAACSGEVTYTIKDIDGNNKTYTFTFEFVVVDDNSYIKDITFNTLYTLKHDSIYNSLYVNQEYEDVLSYSITAEGGKFNSSFASSGVYFSIPDTSLDKIEFIMDGDVPTGIKTLNNPGTAEILVVSKYETDIGYSNPTSVTIGITISDKPTKSIAYYNDNEIVDLDTPINIARDTEDIFVDFKLFNIVTLKDGQSFENEILMEYNCSIENDTIITYDPVSKLVHGINGGSTTITFSLDDPELVDLTKVVKIDVLYTPVDVNSIKLTFQATNNNIYNPYSPDFSKIPLGLTFNVLVEVNDDATNGAMGFSSSNPEIIEIDAETGVSKAVAVGTATIKVYSIEEPEIFVEKTITVTNTTSPFELFIDYEDDDKKMQTLKGDEFKVTLNNVTKLPSSYSAKLSYGESYRIRIIPKTTSSSTTLTYTYIGANADEKIATIDKAGYISTKAVGKQSIRITYGDPDCIQKYSVDLNLEVERSALLAYSELHTFIRKLFGHYGLFLCTAIPAMMFVCLSFSSYWKKLIATGVTTVIGFAVAGFSELVQMYTPGRGPSWKDVGIDFGGFVTTTAIFAVLFLIIILVKHVLKLKKQKIEEKTEVKKECKSEAQLAYEKRKLEKKLSKENNKNKNNKNPKKK